MFRSPLFLLSMLNQRSEIVMCFLNSGLKLYGRQDTNGHFPGCSLPRFFRSPSSSALGQPIEELVESGNLSVPPVALPSATANELPEPARRQRENLA